MPADRSKTNRHVAGDVPQLVWTLPVDPSSVAASPGSSSDDDGLPPLVDPNDFVLFPPSYDIPSPRKPAHSKKKPEDHIPRPPNAFILFRSSFIKSQHVPTGVETNHSTLSKIIGLTWKNLPNDERLIWHAKAKEALDEHKKKFPQYAFRPNQSRYKGSSEKRRVREVGPKDHKRCAKIAELLVEGKKGQELDEAIQEFDKHHVPEIVTRFEAPLTARMYCRSSSEPVLDELEGGEPAWHKSRSTSTQPTTPDLASAGSPILTELNAEVLSRDTSFSTLSQSPFPSSSPSFEFDPFSFDNQPSPMCSYESCGPHTQPSSPMPVDDMVFNTTHANTSALSIDTTFLGFEDWNCPSPLSEHSMPATPLYMESPIPDAFGSHSQPPFDDTLSKSLGGQFSAYQSGCDPAFLSVYDPDSASPYSIFDQSSCPQVHMANPDHVFSVFMASLPEYAV